MQSWLEGRNCVGKSAQATGMTASLRILSSKADSNTWESFTRSGLKLHQESPRSDVFRKRATKPLLKQKQHQRHLTWAKEKKNWTFAQRSKVLFSDKSKFCISFGNQGLESGGRLERHRIQAAWSPVWSLRSQWWFGVLWPLLVLVHCVLSSPKSMQPSTRRFGSTLCFHLLTSFMEMLSSFSSRTLAPAHSAKTTSKWFADNDMCLIGQPTCLTWTPYGIYGIFSRERWETVDPTIQTSWRLNSASAVPQADRFHATPHWCWSLC